MLEQYTLTLHATEINEPAITVDEYLFELTHEQATLRARSPSRTRTRTGRKYHILLEGIREGRKVSRLSSPTPDF